MLGDGGVSLLRAIDENGSIRAAATRVGWSYRHTLAYLDNAEATLGRQLVERARGGNERGGTQLTREAREFVRRYVSFRARADAALLRLYRSAFGT